jgi:hypothetical protein
MTGECIRCHKERVYKIIKRKLCGSCYMATWWAANKHRPEIYKAMRGQTQARRTKYRRQVLFILGDKCICCGEANLEFLSVDHIHGDGANHRKKNSDIWYSILKEGCPPDRYRILCHNCNQSMGFYGYCPHGNIEPATYHSRLRWKDLSPEQIKKLVHRS